MREKELAYQNFRPLFNIKLCFFLRSCFSSFQSSIQYQDTKSRIKLLWLMSATEKTDTLMCGHIVSGPYFVRKNYDVILVTWEQLKGAVANRNMWFVLVL